MRQGQQNRRGRGRGNQPQSRKGQHHHNPLMRTYQSNGPDQKIHGTPAQIAEKYMSLARDALSSGDPVLAENYLQHAEHYNRIILTYREQQIQQNGGEGANSGLPRHRQFQVAGEPLAGDGEDGDDMVGDQPGMSMRANEPQPRMYDSGQPREDRQQRQGGEHGYRDQGAPRDRERDRDRDREGGGRDREFRDGGRGFRQRDQRFGHDRGDRGQMEGRGDRQERFSRGEANGERVERFDRGDRPDRGPRPSYGDRPDRPERGERFERGERQERFERPDRAEGGERRIPVGGGDTERVVETPAPAPAPTPVAEAVPAPRRRERFADAATDQPEFLRRPVRRPRREAAAPVDAGDGDVPATRPAAPDAAGGE
jgi:hypothetical protein